jgi:hypothetical protein
MLHLEQHLAPNQVKSRKRHKKGLPAAKRVMLVQLHQPSGGRIEVCAHLAMSAPLDAPATITMELARADLLPVGSVLEFEVRDAAMPAEPEVAPDCGGIT